MFKMTEIHQQSIASQPSSALTTYRVLHKPTKDK